MGTAAERTPVRGRPCPQRAGAAPESPGALS